MSEDEFIVVLRQCFTMGEMLAECAGLLVAHIADLEPDDGDVAAGREAILAWRRASVHFAGFIEDCECS